jgi:hypothetical protein
MQGIIRFLIFCIFFTIGLSALGLSILCDDLVSYYRSKDMLNAVEASNKKLHSLKEDYDVLLEQLRANPGLLRRAARVTRGSAAGDANAIYPRATAEELAAARAALTRDSDKANSEVMLPEWLERIRQPRRRFGLFLSGASLILIAFIFFGPTRKIFLGQ